METTPVLTDYKCNKIGNVCINITLRGVCAAIVAVIKQEMLHILSVCL